MGSLAYGLVRGKVVRFTLLDSCGNPQTTNSMYVAKALVSVNSTKNMDTGDEIKVRQIDGTIGEYEPGKVTTLNITHDIQFIKIDPAALAMLTGDPVVLNAAGTTTVGWEEKAQVPLAQNFAMELWTDTAGAFCASPGKIGGYMLYPLIGQGYVTFDNVTDKEVTATVHGIGYGNPQWGRGPYGTSSDGSSVRGPIDISTGGIGTPGRLLNAVDAAAMRHFELTAIAPPAAFTTPGPISITLPSPY